MGIKINSASWGYASDYGGYSIYYFSNAFDGSTSSLYQSRDVTDNKYIRFEPPAPVVVDKFRVYKDPNWGLPTIEIYGSDHPTGGTDATLLHTVTPVSAAGWEDIEFENLVKYRYYWFKLHTFPFTRHYWYEIEVWGPELPLDAPDTEKIHSPSDTYSWTFDLALGDLADLFDEDTATGISQGSSYLPETVTMELDTPATCNALRFIDSRTGYEYRFIKDFTLYGSTDGAEWVEILTDIAANSSKWQTFYFNETAEYGFYRLEILTNWGNATFQVCEIELYGTVGSGGGSSSDGVQPIIFIVT